jgi:uncharacterized iron-regulated membrane protein
MRLWGDDQALAGHAGDTIVSSMMPHEVASLLVGILVGLGLLAGLSGLILWRLRRLRQRVERLEAERSGRPSRS